MLYLNSYIRMTCASTFFRRSGNYFDALVVSRESTEFTDFLSVLEKPLYAISAAIRMSIIDDTTSERLPNVTLSESAKNFIFRGAESCSIERSRIRSPYTKGTEYESAPVLIIPVIYRSLNIGVTSVATDINMPMQYMNCKDALFYTKEQPEGYVDTSLMDEPLNILEGRSSLIIKDSIASEYEISSALWKMRNRIHIKRVYASKTKFWNELFTMKGKTTDVRVRE